MLVKTFEELKLSGQMPSPSGVGMRVLEITRREDFSTSDLGDTIRADSALTGRILKLANSAARAGVEPVTTVSDSIMRLGTRSVRDLALAFSLVSGNRKGSTAGFDYDLYWSQSLARAVCCQEVCRQVGSVKPEEAYICGLLSDIGQLAMASVYKDAYARIWLEHGAVGEMDALRELEQEQYDIHHGQVCVFLMKEWGLPDLFAEAVESFTTSRALAKGTEGNPDLVDVLRLAEVLSTNHLCKVEVPEERRSATQEQIEAVRKALDMEPEEFQALQERCRSEWSDWGEALGVETDRVAEMRATARKARIALGDGDPDAPEAGAEQAESGGREEAPETAVAQPVASHGSDEDATAGEEQPIRILAVDDDPVSLRVLVRHLERGGYEVLQASNGRSALRMALQECPDVVISDWVMPELDGIDLCRELRKIDAGRRMYFLLITGRAEEERIVEAFEAGADDYVTKPFVPRILSARIKGASRLVALQRQVQADKETMMQQVTELGKMTRKLRAAALTDPLTQLPNRRYAMRRLESEWSSLERTGRPMSVIMMDIDHFKSVNDNHGHDVGDAVLVETARVLADTTRDADEVCRMGGEEFLSICRGTDLAGALAAAERLRAAVEANIVRQLGFDRAVTLSLGVASATDAGEDSITALLKRADEAVYKAKAAGRNQVCTTESRDLRKSA